MRPSQAAVADFSLFLVNKDLADYDTATGKIISDVKLFLLLYPDGWHSIGKRCPERTYRQVLEEDCTVVLTDPIYGLLRDLSFEQMAQQCRRYAAYLMAQEFDG